MTRNAQSQFATLVEERTFDVPYEEAAPLLEQALEYALGAKLQGLTAGMWQAEVPLADGNYLDATVRALRAKGGTSVEVRLETKTPTGRPLAQDALPAEHAAPMP